MSRSSVLRCKTSFSKFSKTRASCSRSTVRAHKIASDLLAIQYRNWPRLYITLSHISKYEEVTSELLIKPLPNMIGAAEISHTLFFLATTIACNRVAQLHQPRDHLFFVYSNKQQIKYFIVEHGYR